jgi:hypothetical protein
MAVASMRADTAAAMVAEAVMAAEGAEVVAAVAVAEIEARLPGPATTGLLASTPEWRCCL